MIATGGAIAFTRRLQGMGLEQQAPEVDVEALTERIESIKMRLQRSTTNLLDSQGVTLVHGTATLLSARTRWRSPRRRDGHPRCVAGRRRPDRHRHPAAHPRVVHARRRAHPHHPRLLPAEDVPRRASPSSARASPAWSSCTCSARSAPRSRWSSAASRCCPRKDPEVAAVLEDDFLQPWCASCSRVPGPRPSSGVDERVDEVVVRCDDGRVVRSSHAVLAIGSVPNTDGLGLRSGRRGDGRRRLRHHQPALPEQRAAHLRRRRRQRQAAAVQSWPACRAARWPST